MPLIKINKKILFGILIFAASILLVILFVSQSNLGRTIERVVKGAPELISFQDFIKKPSDLFLIKEENYGVISRANPYMGTGTACSHKGGHIHFTSDNKPYEVDIISPVDGYISMVNSCVLLNAGGTYKHDKFDIGISFAQINGAEVSLNYSIEPFAGENCQIDKDFYKKYIFVNQGQLVKKGDVIAKMPKLAAAEGDGTHIHFQLNWNGSNSNQIYCPNIFSKEVEEDFQKMLGGFTCKGEEFPATFCFKPAKGEDLTELL